MILQSNFRAAWRSIWKNRSVNWINVAGLSAGMTAAILIFLWVQNEMTYDRYHANADRIYRTTSRLSKSQWVWAASPLPLSAAVRESMPEIEQTAMIQATNSISFRIKDEFFPEKQGAYVDRHWFDLFHYDFVEGNAASLFQQPFSLLLTQSKAHKYFGNRPAVGEVLRIDSVNYVVKAVVKDNPANSSFQFDVLIPFDAYLSNPDRRKNSMTWNNFNVLTFLRARPGADPARIRSKLTELMARNKKGSDVSMDLVALKDMHFETDLTSDNNIEHANRKTVYIFGVLGVFLLVIACINYINLTTARASLRAKEVSIRKMAGAGKGSLFAQFILESLLISMLALAVTLVLVYISLPFYRELTGRNFLNPFLSIGMWEIIGGTLATATFLNGIYPAILLSSFQPLNVFKGVSILKVKDVYFRKGLVVLQFTFSVILIISTIVIQRQLNFIQHTNPGYDRSQIFSFTLPYTLFKGQTDDQKEGTLNNLKHELLMQTSIKGVSVASQSVVHLNSSNSGSADWDGHDTSFNPTVFQLSADEDYKNLFQLELTQGHWFRPDNPTDKHNFVLNETAVKEFSLHRPVLGQRFVFQGDTGQVMAVVKDFHFSSMHDKIAPMVFFDNPGWRSSFFVKTQVGKTPQALASAKALWQRFNPQKPFEYNFMDEEFDKMYKADTKLSSLILIFSVIAILISSLGLFGLAAFTAEQRTKEIGIRKILGATVAGIVSLLSRDFVRLVVISIGIATPVAAWAMHKWLQDFAYHIPVSISIFALAGLLAILIALVTVSYQSIRAANGNPVKNLRSQ